RIAIETLEIFVPLADRLGMGHLRGEMEDYAFPHAYPEEYKKVTELLKQRSKLNQQYLEKIHRSLQKKLAEHGITGVKIDYRIKRMYSLFKKLQRNEMDIDKIHDVVALRVVVSTIGDCYSVLGIVHNIWRPLPGRIKDYIATPKLNGYQSLHTTIFTGDGGIAEIQIRTKEMHDEAEYGIASHLSYKETENGTEHLQRRFEKQLPWIKQLLEWQKNTPQSGEFLEHLRTEFFKDRVFVFTPDGDVIDLPEESSPIDFAYAIHTDIGNHLSGVKINGKMVSLDTPLKTGDIIEIVTKKGAHPTTKWLKYAKTALAKKQIRSETANGGLSLKSFFPNLGKK
ncbi:MAG: TGS domain-containing protein, partial [Patescibacteria group bacterium]|nr:TGS domain-containing protein [Patescibacteria group bacterium]